MKKGLSLFLSLLLVFSLTACNGNEPPSSSQDSSTSSSGASDTESIGSTGTEASSADNTTTGSTATGSTTVGSSSIGSTATSSTATTSKVPASTVPKTVQRWVANEIHFQSDKEYKTPVYTVDMDVVFQNKKTGTKLTVPAFWNGGKEWVVRFALTELGDWTYQTSCTDQANKGLHKQSGTITCNKYTGNLDIYKHGFLKVKSGVRTFVYNDGTPFFYLGDTHWSLPLEEIDSIGNISQSLANQYGITSQFKYIMDYRAKQGYTVIQTQPLGRYNGVSGNSWFGNATADIFMLGVNDEMLEKFQEFDRYFDYIAEKGFVNANSQLAYPEELIEAYLGGHISDKELEKLCRYWVARYSAYPVMWTTTQEGDNDYYEWGGCTPQNNPWLKVMDYVAKHDPYDHPSTCHQENTGHTIVEESAFGTLSSHDWYAGQFFVSLDTAVSPDFTTLKKYWNNSGSKPFVRYEGFYDHYQTGTYGARAQGWTAYLNGAFGYGYGVQPIWNIYWAERGEKTPVTDERETYERDLNWVEGLYSECGQQLIYMKSFLTQYDWWKLTPCFRRSEYFEPKSTKSNYSVATIGNELYLGYFYGTSGKETQLGTFLGMKNGKYKLTWLNCRTGKSTTEQITVTNGKYIISGKPDTKDWALSAQYVSK